jgi:1-acylglycerone phosphate reductase
MLEEWLTRKPDSNYRYLEKKINMAWEQLEGDAMSPSVYARQVVAKVVKSNPPEEIWCGSGATTIWLIETLGIRWVYNIYFARLFGMNDTAPSSQKDVKGS